MSESTREAVWKWALGITLTVTGAVIAALWVSTTDRFDECRQRATALEQRVNQLEREQVTRAQMRQAIDSSGPYIADRQSILQSLREIRKVGELKESIIRLSVTMESLSKSVEKINTKLDERDSP